MEPPEAILNSSQNLHKGPEEDAEKQREDEHMDLRFKLISEDANSSSTMHDGPCVRHGCVTGGPGGGF